MFARYRQDRCYIIAEIAGNFSTVADAFRLIDAAASCKVDAIKLQTFKAHRLVSRSAIFEMENTGKTSQFEIFEKYELNAADHKAIFDYINSVGLDWFSTPSHADDLDLLESLGVGAHKIGSDDASNLPFLYEVAKIGKPIFLSTGMCTLAEVKDAVELVFSAGDVDLKLLHAITCYPTHSKDVNLSAMLAMKSAFPALDVGYSDHTIGPVACICAAALGARIIEKHFTLDKSSDGPDHMLSADPTEMRFIVDSIRTFEEMRGDGIKRPAPSETSSLRNNRKSLVMIEDVSAGEQIQKHQIAVKRPGFGIAPKNLDIVIGKFAKVDLKADSILTWDDIR